MTLLSSSPPSILSLLLAICVIGLTTVIVSQVRVAPVDLEYQQQLQLFQLQQQMNLYKNVSVSIVPVASGPRSSSTFFTSEVFGTMPCHLTLNEILLRPYRQSCDAWDKEGVALGFANYHMNATSVDPALLAKFIIHVGKRRCHEQVLSQSEKMADFCHNHCFVTYKQFYNHFVQTQKDLDIEEKYFEPSAKVKHQQLWHALMQQLPPTSFAMISLERTTIEDQWRSFYYAIQTDDWEVLGDGNHKQRLADTYIPPPAPWFVQEHEEWFRTIGQFAQQQHAGSVPFLELTYADITTKPVDEIQTLVRQRITRQPELPASLENAQRALLKQPHCNFVQWE